MPADHREEILKSRLKQIVSQQLHRVTPAGQVASIHHILLDSRGQRATIIVGFYPPKDAEKEDKILKELAPEIRYQLAKNSRHRFVPEIILELDQSEEIQRLLDQKFEN